MSCSQGIVDLKPEQRGGMERACVEDQLLCHPDVVVVYRDRRAVAPLPLSEVAARLGFTLEIT